MTYLNAPGIYEMGGNVQLILRQTYTLYANLLHQPLCLRGGDTKNTGDQFKQINLIISILLFTHHWQKWHFNLF